MILLQHIYKRIITHLSEECVIVCQNKAASSLLATDSVAQLHLSAVLTFSFSSTVAAHEIKYRNVLWSLSWPFFVASSQNINSHLLMKSHSALRSLQGFPLPLGSAPKCCPKEVIGERLPLLSFKDAGPHINKIYNDQTAFLKIDDPQIAASLSCQYTPLPCLQWKHSACTLFTHRGLSVLPSHVPVHWEPVGN